MTRGALRSSDPVKTIPAFPCWASYALLSAGLVAVVALGTWVVARIAWSHGYAASSPLKARNDVGLYFRWSSEMLSGRVPYRDFLCPYPPLSLLLLPLPRLLGSSLRTFTLWYSLETLALNSVLVVLIHRAARERGTDPGRALQRYAEFIAPLACLVIWRMDLAIALACLWGALEWERGRSRAAAAILAAGTMLKVIPALIFGVEFLKSARSRQRWRACAGALTVFTFLCVSVCAAWLWIGGARAVIRLHAERGLEFGSTYAGILMVWAKATGQPLKVLGSETCSCLEVTGLPRTIALLKTASTVILLGAFAFLAWRILRDKDRDSFRWCAAALLTFMLTFKVLSPQYLLWCAPFICLLEGAHAGRVRWAFLAACLLTWVIFPLGFDYLVNQNVWLVATLNARNAALAYCAAALISANRMRPAAGGTKSSLPEGETLGEPEARSLKGGCWQDCLPRLVPDIRRLRERRHG